MEWNKFEPAIFLPFSLKLFLVNAKQMINIVFHTKTGSTDNLHLYFVKPDEQ